MSRESSLGSDAMEEEEDDLYGTAAATAQPAAASHMPSAQQDESEEEDDEDDDSDSDLEIITERADLVPEPTTSRSQKATESTEQIQQSSTSNNTPATTQITARPAPTTIRITSDPSHPLAQPKPVLLPGDKYPAIHSTSKSILDLDHIPLWNGKPVTELDIDADLAEQMKPWRRPGADQADYFNYGFDEFTWAMYCQKQKAMRGVIDEQKNESKMFEQMMGGMGMPGMPGAVMGGGVQGNNSPMPPTGPMGQQPSEGDMQAMMMQAMQAQGISDPSQLDFSAFMQQFGAMGGGGPPQGVPTGPSSGGGGQQQGWGGQQGGYGQGGGQGGRRGGRGRW